MTTLIGYKKCSTCKDVEKFLQEKGIDYSYREIDKDTPSKKELTEFKEKSGLDTNKFFNSSGNSYRELGLKDKKDQMSDEEKFDLMEKDGMLIKRPILVTDNTVILGRANIKKYFEE